MQWIMLISECDKYHIMQSQTDASKEELIETIETLKEENEKTVDELMVKLRSIEGEQLKTNISNRQLEGKI